MRHRFDPRSTAHAPALLGVVRSGVGEGTHFMALDWVLAQCRERLGFTPSPGTFNLRMQGQRWAQLRLALHNTKPGARQPGIELTPPSGYCAASCFALRVGGVIDAWAIVPHIDDYPHDKLEIIAPVNLRTALGIANGDQVGIEIAVHADGCRTDRATSPHPDGERK